MPITFRNDSLTPVGLWDDESTYHVVAPLGGTVTLEPDTPSREVIDLYAAGGSGAVADAVAPTVNAGTIAGDPVVGSILTVEPTVSGEPSPVVSVQWLADGEPIDGATSPSYTVAEPDEGAMLSCAITATNAVGSASDTTSAVGPVTAPEEG